jgi:chromosome segregation ATPase
MANATSVTAADRTQIGDELVAYFARERKKLLEYADRCKARLDDQLAARDKARKEYKGLVEKLEAKKEIAERLPAEISELEAAVMQAERIKDDDETGPFSRIKSCREDCGRAQYEVSCFVQRKMEQLKREA